MVRGDYTVQEMEGLKPARRDGSFKSCVITMFIVFLLCVIIVLIVWRIKPAPNDRYFPADESGKADAFGRRSTTSRLATEPPGIRTSHDNFVTTETPHITTKKIQTITAEKSSTIKDIKSRTMTPVPTTQKIAETPTAPPTTHQLPETTSHITVKHDPRLGLHEDNTTSVPKTTDTPFTTSTLKYYQSSRGVKGSQIVTSSTTDSTTVKQKKTTTVVSHHTLVNISESDNTSSSHTTGIPSTTTESIVRVKNETVTTGVPLGGITLIENNYTTVSSDATSTIRIQNDTETTLHALVNDSNRTTPGVVIVKTTSKFTNGTSETETATTSPIPVATTKPQNVSSSPTTIPSTTTGKANIPLVILYSTAINTESEPTDTSTSLTDFETTTSSETVPDTTESDDGTTDDYVTSEISIDSTPGSDEETTTNAPVSQIFVAVTESQNTISNTSAIQSLAIINSTDVTNDVETTTNATINVTDSQNTTVQSQVVISTTTPISTTHKGTSTGGLVSQVSVAVTDSQNTTLTASTTTLKAASTESETASIEDKLTTPAVHQTTIENTLTTPVVIQTATEGKSTTPVIIQTTTEGKSTIQTTTEGKSTIQTTTEDKSTTTTTSTVGLVSQVSVAVTDSQNTTVTASTITLKAASTESETASIEDKLTTPVVHQTTTEHTLTTPVAIQTTRIDKEEACPTSECKVLASRILSLMNHSMDPCDNFYEFACGGLRDNHGLLQEDPALDVWNRIAHAVREVNSKSNLIHQKFRHFYDQCVDYENTVNQSERLRLGRKVVREVDKMYNNLEWEQANDNFNLTDILVKLFQVNSAPLFDVSIDVNPHNTTKFQLKLTVPRSKSNLQLESLSASRCKSHIFSDDPNNISMAEVYHSNYLPCIRNFSDYFVTLEKAVKEMALFDNTSAYNISQNIAAIKFFVEFDVFSLFEEINPWEVRTNSLEKKFKMMTVKDLSDSYPEVDWKVLFDVLLNNEVNSETEVQVYFQSYFDKLFEQFRDHLSNATARLIIHNGLLAMLAHDIYVDLVKPRPCNREEYCLRIASQLMEDVSSSLYLSTFTSKELSDKQLEMDTLFEQLKNVLEEEIMHANWLDEESHSSMVDKIHNMKVMADGGKAILSDVNYLRNQLNDNDLSISNNYFENAIQLQRRYRKLIYYLVSYDTDPSNPEVIWTFFHLPYDTHPISVYQLNIVIIPFGMIGSWKPTNKVPSFVWKARIGNKIARQIVHHFDTTGMHYGSKGKDNDFLQDSPKALYYENYEGCEEIFDTWGRTWTNQKNQIYHYTVNAARTLYEHFTDNSALWLTHKLFSKTVESEPVLPWLEMSHDELYLLLAAQEFCAKAELLDYTVMMFETEQLPPYLRAENMIVNSQMFGGVYSCPVGGKQNPNVKCPPFPQGPEDTSDHSSGPVLPLAA